MNFELLRYSSEVNDTLGVLYNGSKKLLCYTLEDEYRAVKIKHETRIPAGKYELTLRTYGLTHEKYKSRFGSDWHKGTIQLKDVPNFTDILIHIGNYETDTSGCILIGSAPTVKRTLVSSTDAYVKIYPILRDAILKEKSYITIIDYN